MTEKKQINVSETKGTLAQIHRRHIRRKKNQECFKMRKDDGFKIAFAMTRRRSDAKEGIAAVETQSDEMDAFHVAETRSMQTCRALQILREIHVNANTAYVTFHRNALSKHMEFKPHYTFIRHYERMG